MKYFIMACIIASVLLLHTSRETISAVTPYRLKNPYSFPEMPVNPDNVLSVEGIQLGRYLFYDPVLSADSSISCASCHKQSAAFSDAPNQFSTGIENRKSSRNAPQLFNLAWYNAYFWDGKALTLEEQVYHPVPAHDEMNLQWPVAIQRLSANPFYQKLFKNAFNTATIDSVLVAKAIAQFERILISADSKFDKVLRSEATLSKEEFEGYELMNDMTKGDCLHCHTTDSDPLGTTLEFSNNGLDSSSTGFYKDNGRGNITGRQTDNGKFKIPSLRNVALTAPYMHDGRFKTLREVLDFYSEGVHSGKNTDKRMEYAYKKGAHLSEEEKGKIISFLHTLTDTSFTTNNLFSNPFIQ